MTHKCTHTINETVSSTHVPMTWIVWLDAGKMLFANDFKKIMSFIIITNKRAASRHQLSQLNEDVLKDVGLTKVQIQVEIEKPFWKE